MAGNSYQVSKIYFIARRSAEVAGSCLASAHFIITAAFIALSLSACSIFAANEEEFAPETDVPVTYSEGSPETKSDLTQDEPWWNAYSDPNLNQLITSALTTNYSLQSAWNRLQQSQAQYEILFSERIPAFDLNSDSSRTTIDTRGAESANSSTASLFGLGGEISYEIDLWGRVRSQASGGKAKVRATRADVENTALILSGRIAELWIRAQEQRALIKLIRSQIKVGETLVELTRLRFQVGQGSILDVYQQQQQLDSTRSELPVAVSTYKQVANQIAVLIGLPPARIDHQLFKDQLPDLPPFPELVSPAVLLESRPDLRALREQVRGAEHEVNAAVADRFPRIDLALVHNFSAQQIADVFRNAISRIASSIGMPLVDGSARRAAVDERKAVAAELKNLYSQSFLQALQDLENAVVAERYQLELIERLNGQIKFARSTLSESRQRYMNGLTDYLQVTLALQSLQTLERRLISEQRDLLLARNRLYLSLGGTWTQKLSLQEEQAV